MLSLPVVWLSISLCIIDLCYSSLPLPSCQERPDIQVNFFVDLLLKSVRDSSLHVFTGTKFCCPILESWHKRSWWFLNRYLPSESQNSARCPFSAVHIFFYIQLNLVITLISRCHPKGWFSVGVVVIRELMTLWKSKIGVVNGVISSTESESEESEGFHFFRFRLRLRRLWSSEN